MEFEEWAQTKGIMEKKKKKKESRKERSERKEEREKNLGNVEKYYKRNYIVKKNSLIQSP